MANPEESMMTKEEFFWLLDSFLLVLEKMSMLRVIYFLFPVQVLLLAIIYVAIVIVQRFIFAEENIKEHYFVFLLGRIPTFLALLCSFSRLSKRWVLLLLFGLCFVIRMDIYISDYFNGGVIYEHFGSSSRNPSDLDEGEDEKLEKEKPETEEKEVENNRSNNGLEAKETECASDYEMEKSEVEEEETTEDETKEDSVNLKLMELKTEMIVLKIYLQKAIKLCKTTKKDLKKILHSSNELYRKQLLKWEKEKEELVSQLKSSTCQNCVKENENHSKDDDVMELFMELQDLKWERDLWNEERNELNARLTAAGSNYEKIYNSYAESYRKLAEERNDLAAKLCISSASAEYYKARLSDTDVDGRKLLEENRKLSSKLFSETLRAENLVKIVKDSEEKCKRLEEDNRNLVANLSAAKVTVDMYRSYMHNYAED